MTSDEEDVQGTPTMTAAQQKLFELRLRMNKGRKENHGAVLEEDRRLLNPKEEMKKRSDDLWQKKDAEYQKELQQTGLSMEDWRRLNVPVADAAERTKPKKVRAGVGVDEGHNAYKKRLRDVKSLTKDQYEELKTDMPNDEFYRGADSLRYGQEPAAFAKPLADKMAAELEYTRDRRQKYSRKRKFNEDGKIDFVNQKNRQFNEKLDKAYSKYTAEIERTLERGTAL